MAYIDSHCHLADNYFYRDIENLIPQWQKNKIVTIGSIATNPKTSRRNIELHRKYPSIIKPGIGRHPWGAHKFDDSEKEIYTKLIKNNKISIIGEVGLDHYFVKDKDKQERQNQVFTFFIEMAHKSKRPLMIHLTGAEKEVYELLLSYNPNCKICCHWYSGPENILKKLIELDCYFSINPTITRSINHQRVLEKSPINRILTESDGPTKYNNEKASPGLMPELCKIIADRKNIEREKIEKQIHCNFKRYLK